MSRGFVLMQYGTGANLHTMKRWVDIDIVGTPFTPHSVNMNNDISRLFTDAVDDMLTFFKPMFATTVDFVSCELWSQPTDADDPLLLEVYSPAESGSSASTTSQYMQLVITFFSESGIVNRLYLMEPIGSVNQIQNYPFPAGTPKNITDYLVGNQGWFRGKDNAKWVGGRRYLTKTNDALRKRGQNL